MRHYLKELPTQLKQAEQYTEAQLVHLLQGRKEDAFAYLYDHYSAALNAIIYGVVGNAAVCEDVLQEVFIRIFRKIEQYDSSKSRLYTWMAQIARNAAIDWMRKTGNQVTLMNQKEPDDVPNQASTSINPDTTDIRQWIARLPKPEQQVLRLAYLEGHTQEEISQLLQTPLGTIKSRVRSGLVKLRTLMQANR